jgi:DNA polymerase (family 10)
VAAALEEVGLLLELKGENPFKTRAYSNAARTLLGLRDDLEAMVETGEISKIRGIGKALSEKITTLVKTGSLPYLEELRAQVPDGLLEWIKIPGLGPKKARAIHQALGITTLGELEYACRENRLRDLEGFGEKSQEKILSGIEQVRRHAGRFLQPVVRDEAGRLLALVLAVDGVRRAEVCGSVRRRSETSKDIDVVVSADDAEPVMDAFAGDAGVLDVIGRGPTKCSVRLKAGPSADLRVVDDRSYPFAVMYFTGSKAHNIAIRGRARKAGLRLNEYGLTPDGEDASLTCADEAEIYHRLGLDDIVPEIREDYGEIEAAEAGSLPDLIRRQDLRGALHCHSSWSDGSATIEEMAEACRSRGFDYLGLCDHSQAAAYAGGLDATRVAEQHEEIDRINAGYDGAFHVLKGIEVDILPGGSLDFPGDVLATFDLVVASVHSAFNLTEDEQTERFLRALNNPYVDIIGHPTGRLLLARDPYPVDLQRVIRAAAERGVAVELNAHPQRLDLDWQGLRYGLERGMKTSINPDAHAPEGLDDVEYGIGIARKGWCTVEDVVNAWPLERLLDHLVARRRDAGIRPR